MEREEFTELTRQIASGELDEAGFSDALVRIQEGYDEISSSYAQATEELNDLREKNTSLKEANYNLFLKVGQRVEPQPQHSPSTIPSTPDEYLVDIGEYK